MFSFYFYSQIICFALVLSIFLKSSLGFNMLNKNISFLFTSQITIISIIAAITILTITLSGKYGTRFTQELKYYPDVWIIGVYYIVAFLFNLFYLGNSEIEFIFIFFNTHFLAIFFEIATIFVLIGYSYNILTILQPVNLINYYVYIASIAINDKHRYANAIFAIFDLIQGLLYKGDTYTANHGLKELLMMIRCNPKIKFNDGLKYQIIEKSEENSKDCG